MQNGSRFVIKIFFKGRQTQPIQRHRLRKTLLLLLLLVTIITLYRDNLQLTTITLRSVQV